MYKYSRLVDYIKPRLYLNRENKISTKSKSFVDILF